MAGNTERHTYTSRFGTDVTTIALEITVLGAATFNGTAVVNSRWKSTYTQGNGLPVVSHSLSHNSVSGLSMLDHGTTEETSPGVTDDVLTYTPAEVFRFDLTPGQSYSQAIQERRSFAPTVVETRTVATTFVGFEDVNVPAGTFRQACRFSVRETSNTSPAVYTFDTWLSRGDGVTLKFVSSETGVPNPAPSSTTELVSAAINGRVLAP